MGSNRVVLFLLLAFVMYVTLKGDLRGYLQVLGLVS